MKGKWLAVVLAAVLFSGMRFGAQESPPQAPAPPPGDQVQETPPPPSLNRQLYQAVAQGRADDVRALLTAGANPNNALFIAAMNGQAECLKILIDAGAALAGPENQGLLALSMAIFSSNNKMREGMGRRRAERLGKGLTAAQDGGGYDEIIKVLLEHGVPTDFVDEHGSTPLWEASMYGNVTAVSLLLEHGASVDREIQHGGGTALFTAAQFGHGAVVELLLKAGASPDKMPSPPGTEEGVSPDKEAMFKSTPLLVASCGGEHIAFALAMGGEAKNYEFMDNVTGGDYLQAVRALLKAGADPNLPNEKDITPLMAASAAGKLEIVQALLDAGADPNLRDKEGCTALMFAAKSGQPALVELLLSKKADPKAVALDGKTALSIAKGGKSRETVKLLQNALKH